jgi:hypothetical protein
MLLAKEKVVRGGELELEQAHQKGSQVLVNVQFNLDYRPNRPAKNWLWVLGVPQLKYKWLKK